MSSLCSCKYVRVYTNGMYREGDSASFVNKCNYQIFSYQVWSLCLTCQVDPGSPLLKGLLSTADRWSPSGRRKPFPGPCILRTPHENVVKLTGVLTTLAAFPRFVKKLLTNLGNAALISKQLHPSCSDILLWDQLWRRMMMCGLWLFGETPLKSMAVLDFLYRSIAVLTWKILGENSLKNMKFENA